MEFWFFSCVGLLTFALVLQVNSVSALNCYQCDNTSTDAANCQADGVNSNELTTKACDKSDTVCVIYTKTAEDKSIVTYRDCAISCDKIEGTATCASCSNNGCNINDFNSITTTTTTTTASPGSTTQKPNGAGAIFSNLFALGCSVFLTQIVTNM